MSDNPWLPPWDETKPARIFDHAAMAELERIHAGLTRTLIEALPEHAGKNDAEAGAANIITSAALQLQRRFSPQGHVAMVTAILDREPLLHPLRTEFRKVADDKVRKVARRASLLAFFFGALFGLALCFSAIIVLRLSGSI